MIPKINGSKISPKRGIENKVFVHDKKLLSKQNGRDFSGGIRYGSFLYNGVCPDPTSSLTDITVAVAASTGSCFTDDSSTPLTGTIGFICQPGTPSTIHFGYPASATGFVIGGANFAGAVAASEKTGWTWGSIGQPTYTDGSATTHCDPSTDASASCVSTYCGGPCTASCTAPTVTSTGENCAEGGTSTTYFVPTTTTVSNCGSLGHCCHTFTFPSSLPAPCPPESLNTGVDFGSFSIGPDTLVQEYAIQFSSSVSGTITDIVFDSIFTDSTNTYTGKIWRVSDQSILAQQDFPAITLGTQSITLATPLSIAASTNYLVSLTVYPGFSAFNALNNFPHSNGQHLTSTQFIFGNGAGIYPTTPYSANINIDVVFQPDGLC